MVFGSGTARRRRIGVALASALLIACGSGAPAALAAPSPSPSAGATQPSAARPAVLTMTVWVSGSDLMSQGTLASSQDGKPLAGQTINMVVDGQTKATATTDTNGAWQAKVGLDQVPDGNHTVGATFTGSQSDGPAQVQAMMQTRKPQSPTVLTGALSTAAAGPGQEVKAQGSLQSNGQAVPNAPIQLNFGGVVNQATTDASGNYTIKATVPANAGLGSTLTAVLTFAGDQGHPAASLNLPLMVQRVASTTATPSGTPTASPTPTPTPSVAPTPTGSATPGTLVTSHSATPTAKATYQLPEVGVGALMPFLVVGLLALAAAGGLGYWLYSHHGDNDPEE